jgi:hypothetical protein
MSVFLKICDNRHMGLVQARKVLAQQSLGFAQQGAKLPP